MSLTAAVKLWTLIKPIKTIKNNRRRKRNEKRRGYEIELTDNSPEVQEMGGFAIEVVKGFVRHTATAGGVFMVNAGLASQEQVTAAVGAIVTLVGFFWSGYRKWRRATDV